MFLERKPEGSVEEGWGRQEEPDVCNASPPCDGGDERGGNEEEGGDEKNPEGNKDVIDDSKEGEEETYSKLNQGGILSRTEARLYREQSQASRQGPSSATKRP